jgi:predicted dehydrogenase
MPDVVRWGILGTGPVAGLFAQGLSTLQDARIVAVASRSEDRARAFADAFGADRCYTDYAEFFAQPDVDVVYVATPNQRHKIDSISALDAGKAVLCEKPFTTNAIEAAEVIAHARRKNLLCIEGMWMRFLPLMQALPDVLAEIGDISLIDAHLGHAFRFEPNNSLFDPATGGATLDLGVYLISLVTRFLGTPTSVSSQLSIAPTGADDQMSALLEFDGGRLATVSATLRAQGMNDALFLGTRGRVRVHGPLYRANELTVARFEPLVRMADPPPLGFLTRFKSSPLIRSAFQNAIRVFPWLSGEKRISIGFRGNGYSYEAQETMRCLRGGLTESPIMPLDDTLMVMTIVDTIRAGIDRKIS